MKPVNDVSKPVSRLMASSNVQNSASDTLKETVEEVTNNDKQPTLEIDKISSEHYRSNSMAVNLSTTKEKTKETESATSDSKVNDENSLPIEEKISSQEELEKVVEELENNETYKDLMEQRDAKLSEEQKKLSTSIKNLKAKKERDGELTKDEKKRLNTDSRKWNNINKEFGYKETIKTLEERRGDLNDNEKLILLKQKTLRFLSYFQDKDEITEKETCYIKKLKQGMKYITSLKSTSQSEEAKEKDPLMIFYKNLKFTTDDTPKYVKNYFDIHKTETITEGTISELDKGYKTIKEQLVNIKDFEDRINWVVFFDTLYNNANNNGNIDEKFRDKLTVFFQLKQLFNIFDQVKDKTHENRFYFFNKDVAQNTLRACKNNPQNFILTYKENLRTELLKDCEKFEIRDDNETPVGVVYNIEELNNDQEHDDLQVRRLQNLAPPDWCTRHAGNCEGYLSGANSFLFIPNKGDRLLRIQAIKKGNNLTINSITNKENENGANCCQIRQDEDVKNLINFVSTMQANNFNIELNKNIFNFNKMSSYAKKEIETCYQNLINGYNEKINELKQNPAQNQNEIIKLLTNMKKIDFSVLNEDSIKTRKEIIKTCFELLNGEHSKLCIYGLNDIDELDSTGIKEIKQIRLNSLEKINLPNLEKADFINLEGFKGKKIEFQNLKEVRFMSFENPKKHFIINLPELEKIKDSKYSRIELHSFESFNIPKLKQLPKLDLKVDSVDEIGNFKINQDLEIDTLKISSTKLFQKPLDCEDSNQDFLKKTLSKNKELLTKLKDIFMHSKKIIISNSFLSHGKDDLVLTKDEVQEILKEAGIE